ncbi:MAG TPA: YezD family protein [Verrucomicrobia bacterium]|nr:YezD family protein [Verrucomicrobiota bacterium]HOP96802.1 YezD family protein [Verrucomicrobiota bacterium]
MKPLSDNDDRMRVEPWVALVRDQVKSLNFGIVQIVVHGGRVVQIERTEKVRFAHPIAESETQK